MIKFIRIQKLEKGVITHDDQEKEKNKFNFLTEDIVKIEGNNVDEWSERNNGEEIKEEVAMGELKEKIKKDVAEKIQELENELELLNNL